MLSNYISRTSPVMFVALSFTIDISTTNLSLWIVYQFAGHKSPMNPNLSCLNFDCHWNYVNPNQKETNFRGTSTCHIHTHIYIHTAVCNIEGHTHTHIYIYSLDTLPYVYMGWIENKVPLNPVVYHMLWEDAISGRNLFGEPVEPRMLMLVSGSRLIIPRLREVEDGRVVLWAWATHMLRL
jgi:hypothetical protein